MIESSGKELALHFMKLAQENLKKDGSLIPVTMFITENGGLEIVPMPFRDAQQKRISQAIFRTAVEQLKATAAVVICDTYMKIQKDLDNVPKSLHDDPEAVDAILVILGSKKEKWTITCQYKKVGEEFKFEDPTMITNQDDRGYDEWFDGIKWAEFAPINNQ